MIDRQTIIDLDRMRTAAAQVLDYVANMTREEFLRDGKTQDAVALQLIVVGAAAARIALRDANFVSAQSNWPWLEIRGMRNRIAHDYHRLDQAVMWDTAQSAVPGLLKAIDTILQSPQEPPHNAT